MTALVSMFNFFIVYLDLLFCVFFGGAFRVSSFDSLEQQDFARIMLEQLTNGQLHQVLFVDGFPIFFIPIGIFIIGAIIGLAKRLIRG